MATVQDITVPQRVTTPVAKLSLTFALITTNRESGKTSRQEFATPEDRMAAFSRVDVHAYSYRLEEKGDA